MPHSIPSKTTNIQNNNGSFIVSFVCKNNWENLKKLKFIKIETRAYLLADAMDMLVLVSCVSGLTGKIGIEVSKNAGRIFFPNPTMQHIQA